MPEPVNRKPTPGMIAVAAGFGCALVAGIFARDYSSSTIVRLAVPMLAALVGLVVAFKLLERQRDK
jgi:hypothetical protein